MQVWYKKVGRTRLSSEDVVRINKRQQGSFQTEKEAATPKTEGVMKSKLVRATLGFAGGFAVGFIAPYLLFDRMTGNFELVQLPSAFVLGSLNALRVAFGNEEQSRKDNYSFLKWGVPATIMTSAVFSMPLVIFGSGVSFGLLGVLYSRWKKHKYNKSRNVGSSGGSQTGEQI